MPTHGYVGIRTPRRAAILEVVTRELTAITMPSNGIFHAGGSTPDPGITCT